MLDSAVNSPILVYLIFSPLLAVE